MRLGLITTTGLHPIREGSDLHQVVCTIESRRDDWEMAEELCNAGVEYVLVADYEYVPATPMLDAFPNRILIVHNGDLTDRDEFGQRRWVGPQPVLDALLTGVKATRTSLYFATQQSGQGPLFLVGPRHAVPPSRR